MKLVLTRVAALGACVIALVGGAAFATPRPTLVVGGDHEYPPYEYLENGKPTSGKYREIYERWFGVYEEPDLWRYGRYFALAVAVLTGLFAASLLWSRSLNRQVRLQTAALKASEEKLRASEEDLRRANTELRQSHAEGVRRAIRLAAVTLDMAANVTVSSGKQLRFVKVCSGTNT